MSKRPSAAGRRPRRDAATYTSRLDQIVALATDAIITRVDDPEDPDAVGASLELFIKENPRGENYVTDFLYSDPRLPVTIYGVLLSSATGLIIGELELFRAQWGYFDDYGKYVGPEGDWRAKGDDDWDVSAQADNAAQRPRFEGITGALLRGIPIGRILAWAHEAMADKEWHDKGLMMLGLSGAKVVPAPELEDHVRAALERTAAVPVRAGPTAAIPEQSGGAGGRRRAAHRNKRLR